MKQPLDRGHVAHEIAEIRVLAVGIALRMAVNQNRDRVEFANAALMAAPNSGARDHEAELATRQISPDALDQQRRKERRERAAMDAFDRRQLSKQPGIVANAQDLVVAGGDLRRHMNPGEHEPKIGTVGANRRRPGDLRTGLLRQCPAQPPTDVAARIIGAFEPGGDIG